MSIIAAGTTTTTALSSTGNTDGTLQFQVNGTTASVTLNTLGAIGVGSSPGYGTSGQVLTSGGSTVAPSWANVTVPSGTTLTNPTITNYTETTYTANSSTAITLDLANGTLQIITLTGNCTYTFPTATAGKSFTLFQKQDGTGSRTVTWPASVKWPSSTAPTITSTASKGDKFVFTGDGTYWWGSVAGQNYL